MKLLLDTADTEDIRCFHTCFPIAGVTTNPTILSREGGDVVARLKEIRQIIGDEKELHIQVTETGYEAIVGEAKAIVRTFGRNTCVKIPVCDVGLRAAQTLSAEGYSVTVTAIMSAGQALLAANAGARYVAPYVSRIDNLGQNGAETVAEIQRLLVTSGTNTEILAASFKTARAVVEVALAGAGAATVSADVMRKLLSHTSTDAAVAAFAADWKKAFGPRSLGSRLS